ncbi:MAG: amidohydrolase family protein, partial [Planctomycetota bacterium]
AAQLLDETADLLDSFPAHGRLAAAVTPRFAVTCTAAFMADMGKLAAERGAAVQSHLAETVPECELIAELFDGRSYVDVYRDAGLLTRRSIYGHGIYLDDADRRTLADTGAVVAHCPTANSFLRSGTMDRRAHLSGGVNVSLGSDIGGGYERSMVRVARAMVEAAASFADVPADQLPGAAEAWWQITAGNADVLGWADGGRLAAGQPADVLVIEPNIGWLSSSVNPLAMLLFAWDDRWIKRTLVRGRVVYGQN